MISDNSFGSSQEWELLFSLAQELTGNAYTEKQKTGLLANNVIRRAREIGIYNLNDYLNVLAENESEMPHMLSAVTIHTTSWFREFPHFQDMEKDIRERLTSNFQKLNFRVLFAACSTGQEVFSFALMLENIRSQYKNFEYKLDAFDVDPTCVEIAASSIYPLKSANDIMQTKYSHFLKIGKGNAEGLFTFSKEIRSRINWFTASLLDKKYTSEKYDWILCRNVLIYFDHQAIQKIVSQFMTHLKDKNSKICLGHSESVDPETLGLKHLGRSVYSINEQSSVIKQIVQKNDNKSSRKKVLIIDDSAVVREKIKKIFAPYVTVIELAANTIEANNKISENQFDFITLDLQMPGEDGITWVKTAREKGLISPVVLVSDSTIADAPQILEVLGNHVQEYFEKKDLFSNSQLLIDKFHAFSSNENYSIDLEIETEIKKQIVRGSSKIQSPEVILVGASTGGTTALTNIFNNFPKPTPPIVIVQHITSHFAKSFAERLAQKAGLELGEPYHGANLKKNTIYLSWGDTHIGIYKEVGVLKLTTSNAPPKTGHRPSVDFLFDSLSKVKGTNAIAVLLTGMGADGAKGMLKIKQNGHWTICQDKKSSVVFGMPKEAIILGAACSIGNLSEIRDELIRLIHTNSSKKIA